MSLQQKEETPGIEELVGIACVSKAGSQEGGGASLIMDRATREMGGSEKEEKQSEREAQTDGGKDAEELRDRGGTSVEMGEVEDEKKEGIGEKEEHGETKGREQERGKGDMQPGAEAVKDKSSEKVRLIKETGESKKVGEVKDKPKGMEVEKQIQPKKKVGQNPTPTPQGMSHPRSSACSVRRTTKCNIIAKFQQNCPETPVVRNFKVQRTSGSSIGASVKQKILQWCQNKTRHYEGVCIENFSSSWSDGLAFCALVHRFFPNAFDFSKLRAQERARNFALAFTMAESLADCCPLLEVEDMLLMGNSPDPLCVFTYVQALCHHLSKIENERKDRTEEKKEGESMTEKNGERKGEQTTGGVEESKGQGGRKGESGKDKEKSTDESCEMTGEEKEDEKEQAEAATGSV